MDWKILAVLLGSLISAIGLWWRIYLHFINRGRAKLSGVLQVERDTNGKVPEEHKRVLDLTATNIGNELISIVSLGVALKRGILKKKISYFSYLGGMLPWEGMIPEDIMPKHSLIFQCKIGRSYDKLAYCFAVDSTGNKYKLRKREIKTQSVLKIYYIGPDIFQFE